MGQANSTKAPAANSTETVLEGKLLERFIEAATGGPALTAADRKELSCVTRIGDGFFHHRDGFLRRCDDVTALDLSPLCNITSVGEDFLYDCKYLVAIDLTPLSNVTAVGNHFLFGCSGLTALDLSPLRNVEYVGRYFLCGCSGLTELASSPLAKKLGWNGAERDELARLLEAFNNQRFTNLALSWNARKTALLIRNFAPRDYASDALKIWSVMRCVLRFLSPLRAPDAVLIAEEVRMLEALVARRA